MRASRPHDADGRARDLRREVPYRELFSVERASHDLGKRSGRSAIDPQRLFVLIPWIADEEHVDTAVSGRRDFRRDQRVDEARTPDVVAEGGFGSADF